MRLDRIRIQARVLWNGATSVGQAVRRSRDPIGMASHVLTVGRREGLRGVKTRLLRISFPPPPPPPEPLLYREWLESFDHLDPSSIDAARRHLDQLDLPDVLLLAFVERNALSVVSRLVASWESSIHPRWTGVLVLPSDLSPADRRALVSRLGSNARIQLVATEAEVEAALAGFSHVLVTTGGVLLDALSLYLILEAATLTKATVVYADHDHVDESGMRVSPVFKPAYSPAYLSRQNYIGEALLFSGANPMLARVCTALRQNDLLAFDALLPAALEGRTVERVPFPLFHLTGPHRTRPIRPDTSQSASALSVAIVIPTRDGVVHLRACLDALVERTSYDLRRVTVVVVDNDSRSPEMLTYLREVEARARFRVVRHPHEFNFAEINNVGARAVESDILVFLNDDTVVLDPDWLSKLVEHAAQPDVGAVGAKLLFPDGKLQHGGCVAGVAHATVQHIAYNRSSDDLPADVTREMSILTGACLAIRREVFERVGGFDPILPVTWNDVKLCLDCLRAGLRNVYVADPLLVHDESRTREQDKTEAHMLRYFREADYARRSFPEIFFDDPSYSPNLSAERVGELAEPPRVRRPWTGRTGAPRTILMLSAVYRRGFGVPLVIQQQAAALRELGYEIVVGGPFAEDEFTYPGCERVVLGSPKEAAIFAFRRDVSLVVSHTPPFFSVPLFIGAHIPVLAYDYGEPPPELMPEPARTYLRDVVLQKRAASPLMTRYATISQAVKDEAVQPDALVLGLANSHLAAWTADALPERKRIRLEEGWGASFVVLTVCRFGVNERGYKGLDKLAELVAEFPFLHPALARDVVWVVAGRGSEEDVRAVERLGFQVHPNVSDERLIELYKASDAYVSFSRWEGYNLGIGQALAMGLPTLASDIPAHREFPIATTESVLLAARWLAGQIGQKKGHDDRKAIVFEWSDSLRHFTQVVAELAETRSGLPDDV